MRCFPRGISYIFGKKSSTVVALENNSIEHQGSVNDSLSRQAEQDATNDKSSHFLSPMQSRDSMESTIGISSPPPSPSSDIHLAGLFQDSRIWNNADDEQDTAQTGPQATSPLEFFLANVCERDATLIMKQVADTYRKQKREQQDNERNMEHLRDVFLKKVHSAWKTESDRKLRWDAKSGVTFQIPVFDTFCQQFNQGKRQIHSLNCIHNIFRQRFRDLHPNYYDRYLKEAEAFVECRNRSAATHLDLLLFSIDGIKVYGKNFMSGNPKSQTGVENHVREDLQAAWDAFAALEPNNPHDAEQKAVFHAQYEVQSGIVENVQPANESKTIVLMLLNQSPCSACTRRIFDCERVMRRAIADALRVNVDCVHIVVVSGTKYEKDCRHFQRVPLTEPHDDGASLSFFITSPDAVYARHAVAHEYLNALT